MREIIVAGLVQGFRTDFLLDRVDVDLLTGFVEIEVLGEIAGLLMRFMPFHCDEDGHRGLDKANPRRG